MKKKTEKTEINYRPVVFKDSDADYAFLTRSTVETRDTIVWTDGNEYPLYKMEISSASHPFFTGQQRIVDNQGRVDRFEKREINRVYAFLSKNTDGKVDTQGIQELQSRVQNGLKLKTAQGLISRHENSITAEALETWNSYAAQ
jgi:large subunit ribosomal protein L31